MLFKAFLALCASTESQAIFPPIVHSVPAGNTSQQGEAYSTPRAEKLETGGMREDSCRIQRMTGRKRGWEAFIFLICCCHSF